MRAIIVIAIIVIIGIWMSGAMFKKDEWRGIYEVTTSQVVQTGGVFKTQEECRNWMNGFIRPDAYGLECGLNCEPPEVLYGSWVCEDSFSGPY